MTEHIQIRNVSPRVQYVGDGKQTEFPYGFSIFEEKDLKVYFGETLVSEGYTVTGVGSSVGGKVIFNNAPEEDVKITLLRDLVIERLSDFQEGGELRAHVLNHELDYQTACMQQIAESLNRCMSLPKSSSFVDLKLPMPEAGKAILWNANGTALENSSIEINNMMQILQDKINQVDQAVSNVSDKADDCSTYLQSCMNQVALSEANVVLTEQNATLAEQKATEAGNQASTAAQKAEAAAQSADLAQEKATLAEQNATLSGQKATEAGNQASTAAQKAEAAAQSADLAQEKATLAEQNATLAGQKAAEIGNQASTAAQKAEAAAQSADLAQEKATLAEQNATLAGQKAAEAGNQALLAAQNASFAGQNAVLAEEKALEVSNTYSNIQSLIQNKAENNGSNVNAESFVKALGFDWYDTGTRGFVYKFPSGFKIQVFRAFENPTNFTWTFPVAFDVWYQVISSACIVLNHATSLTSLTIDDNNYGVSSKLNMLDLMAYGI